MAKLSSDKARMRRRQVDPSTFSRSGREAVPHVLEHLSRAGIWARENDDMLGPEVIIYRSLKPVAYLSLNWRVSWKEGEFTWDDVLIHESVKGHLKLSLPVSFWILRKDFGLAITVEDYVVSGSPVGEDGFYHVPLESCGFVELAE